MFSRRPAHGDASVTLSPAVLTFLQRWLINTLAVLVAATVVKGIEYDGAVALFVASLLLGILNSFVRPVMLLLTLPLLVFTLGLFTLVINALLLYFVGEVVKGFHVTGFGAAFWGALVISLVSLVVNRMIGTDARSENPAARRPDSGRRPPGGDGPIIDV